MTSEIDREATRRGLFWRLESRNVTGVRSIRGTLTGSEGAVVYRTETFMVSATIDDMEKFLRKTEASIIDKEGIRDDI